MLSTPDLCDQFPDDVLVLDPLFNDYGGQVVVLWSSNND